MNTLKFSLKNTLQIVFVTALLTSSFGSYSQDIRYARKLIKKLASTEFKGRGYVHNGDKRASSFIAKEFKKNGLKPLNQGSYFQEFDLSVNTFPGKVEVKLNDLLLTPGEDYLVATTSPSIKGTYKVLAISRKDIDSEAKFTALIDKAADCFILLDSRPKSEETKEEKSKIEANSTALKEDFKLNFKGFIECNDLKLTWRTLTYQTTRPVITINKKDFNPSEITSIAVTIESKFVPKYTTRNVVGMIEGSSNTDSLLVVTAHYDHLGMMGKKAYFLGANDNASGTAFMLNLARYYSKNQPKYNMVFIAFSGEEIGLLGSRAFVKNPLIDLKKIKFLNNFDLAGTGEEGIRVVNGTIFKSKFDALVQLNQDHNLLPKIDIRGEMNRSDHHPFYEKGVPSFYMYTQGGSKAYHDIHDKPESLSLSEFDDYFKLMVLFFTTL
jgi:aminopeptidase YwaD